MRIGSGAILVLLLLCGLDTELITVTLGTQNDGKQIAARISGGRSPKPKNYYKCGTLVTGKGAAAFIVAGYRVDPAFHLPIERGDRERPNSSFYCPW